MSIEAPPPWTDEQLDWLKHCVEAGYTLGTMAKASGRTSPALAMRASKLGISRPEGRPLGPQAHEFEAALPAIPDYPAGPKRPNAAAAAKKEQDIVVDIGASKRPMGGWKRRCVSCEAMFKTEKLEVVYCAECHGKLFTEHEAQIKGKRKRRKELPRDELKKILKRQKPATEWMER